MTYWVYKYDAQADVGRHTPQRQEVAGIDDEAAREPALMQIAGRHSFVKSMDWPHAGEESPTESSSYGSRRGRADLNRQRSAEDAQQIEGMKAQAAAGNQKNKPQADFQTKQMELQQASCITCADAALPTTAPLQQQSWNFSATSHNIATDLVKIECKAADGKTELRKPTGAICNQLSVYVRQRPGCADIVGYAQRPGELHLSVALT